MASALLRSAWLLALFAAACQSAPPAEPDPPPVVDAQPAAAVARIDWDQAADCPGRLRLLEEAARAGTLPDDPAAIPIAVRVLADHAAWARPEPDWIEADLPLRVVDTRVPPDFDVTCWIEAGPVRDLQADTREVGREQVRSVYQSGSRRERNPDYEIAQIRLRQAEREARASDGKILSVGDPMLDLVGVMVEGVAGAFKGRSRTDELEQAIATLASTQRSIEHPVWRHYHFERDVVRGRRSATVPITLIGPHARARARTTLIRPREVRTFHVLDGLDPRDRDYETHAAANISPLELARWRERPPTVPISALIRALLGSPPPADPMLQEEEEQPTPLQPQGVIAALAPDTAMERPARRPPRAPLERERPRAAAIAVVDTPAQVPPVANRPPAPPPLPRLDATSGGPQLAVLRGKSDGVGIYLSPHTVLAPASLVGDVKVLDAEVQGVLVPALVAAADPSLDLALLKLPRAGRPATFDPDPSLRADLRLLTGVPPGDPVHLRDVANGATLLRLALEPGDRPAIGTPVFSGDRLVGLIIAVEGETARAVSARAIRTLLDRLPDSDLLLD